MDQREYERKYKKTRYGSFCPDCGAYIRVKTNVCPECLWKEGDLDGLPEEDLVDFRDCGLRDSTD